MSHIIQDKLFEIFKNTDDDKICIEYLNKKMTYKEIDGKSDVIANTIIEINKNPYTSIGILMEDKSELIISIIGILKLKNVFVPLDNNYPTGRISEMISISEIKILLIDNNIKSEVIHTLKLNNPDLNIVPINSQFYLNRRKMEKNLFSDLIYNPDDRIYIYFTSGTTGKPNAIVGQNKGLDHFIQWEISQFNIDKNIKVSQLTNQCHDPFLRDIFVPLYIGGTICIPDNRETILNPDKITKWIEKSKINLIHCTPSMFEIINSANLKFDNFEGLKYILLAGEKPNIKTIKKWYEIFNDRIKFINLYGPTETTLAKLFYEIKSNDINNGIIPIGKAIPGSKAIILDNNMNICIEGQVGEIYIRTPYRTLGYYNNPELTALRFIKNPFGNDHTDLIYKTGDLGRFLDNGNIEFVRRKDKQIKIRGYRVEIEEIENRILNYEGINSCIVRYIEDNSFKSKENGYLTAYLVANQEKTNEDNLKHYLKEYLPDYMMPAYMIFMENIPLTPNGKIDYTALPNPEVIFKKDYIEPKNEIEKKLSMIWSEILLKDQIGTNDNFLLLGGSSLNIMSLINKIKMEFNVELSLNDIFQNPVLKELAKKLPTFKDCFYEPLKSAESKEFYPVSSAQKRMYILNKIEGKNTSYNIPKVIKINGLLDYKKVNRVFNELINRHEALRTSFNMIDDQIVQKIHDKVDFNLQFEEIEKEDNDVINARIKKFIKVFDLNNAPLFRAGIIKCSATYSILLFDIHHIISDGMSINILINNFFELYNDVKLPELKIQYKDFSEWQNKLLANNGFKNEEEYWKNLLAEEIPALQLPTDYPRPVVQNFEGNRINFELEEEIAENIMQLSKKTGLTLFMILLGAYNILLSKYTGQEDIVVGSPIAGRPYPDLENVIGMFVNTLVIRNKPEGDKIVRQFLDEVKHNSLNAFENQNYPFDKLVEKLNLNRDMSRNPVFDTMLVLHEEKKELGNSDEFKISAYKFENRVSKLDLTIDVVTDGKRIFFEIEYCTKLFKKETIERLKIHYINILKNMELNLDKKIMEIEIMDKKEQNIILTDFNDTGEDYPVGKTIHEMFEEQVKRTPDSIAVIYEDRQMTYRQLNEKSNQIAGVLRAKGVKPDGIVGIMTDRSFEMMSSIMGILKSGGAYLPIDPKYPQDRIKYMLDEAGIKILLTKNNFADNIMFDGEIINIEDDPLYCNAKTNLETISNPDNILYVIYTSGTTGKPKGVMLKQKNMINLIYHEYKKTEIKFNERVLQFATNSFDVCYQEIFSTLLAGGELHIIKDEDKMDINKLFDFIKNNKIKTVFLPTSFFKYIINENDYLKNLPDSIDDIITAGEQLVISRKGSDYLRSKNIVLHNHYGPSETHVVTTYIIRPEDEIIEIPPIGKPVINNRIYILDKRMLMQPIGGIGELYISGFNVGRGYINRPDLTDEKFINDPFVPGAKMYRTGDLARWMPDGNIEYLGRIDHQVKIRGYRIECGEIESLLTKHEGIKQAVVTARDDKAGIKYLCAYYVSDDEVNILELKKHLSKSLPDYMIPSFFIRMDNIPLTPNGKVDRKELPCPDGNINTGTEYVAPRNDTEKKLAKIWAEVLGADRIGINDNFFELGGHSLKAVTVIQKANIEGINIELSDIINYQTIDNILNQKKMFYGLNDNLIIKSGKPTIFEIPLDKEIAINYKTKRNGYNLEYKATTYPYYLFCNAAMVLEVLKYNYDYNIEKTFYEASEGDYSIGLAEIIKDKSFELLPVLGFKKKENNNSKNFNYQIGMKFFNSLNEGLNYIKKELKENKIVPVLISAYFYNYTYVYKLDKDIFYERLNKNEIIKHYLNYDEIETIHFVLLIDETEQGYIIYDTTFGYFGEVSKEVFEKSFEGLRKIEFLNDHFIHQYIKPYGVMQVNLKNKKLLKYDILLKRLLKKIIQDFSDKREIKYNKSDASIKIKFGINAIFNLIEILEKESNVLSNFKIIISAITEILFKWSEAFARLRNFLVNANKIYFLSDEIIQDIQLTIEDLFHLYLESRNINERGYESFLKKLISKLNIIKNRSIQIFNTLQELVKKYNIYENNKN